MKYQVEKDCDWRSFHARKGQTIDAADLKTADGKPLPANVVDVLTKEKCLVAEADAAPVEG